MSLKERFDSLCWEKFEHGEWEDGMHPCARWVKDIQAYEKDHEMIDIFGLATAMEDLSRSLEEMTHRGCSEDIVVDIAYPKVYASWRRSKELYQLVERRKGEIVLQADWGPWVLEEGALQEQLAGWRAAEPSCGSSTQGGVDRVREEAADRECGGGGEEEVRGDQVWHQVRKKGRRRQAGRVVKHLAGKVLGAKKNMGTG